MRFDRKDRWGAPHWVNVTTHPSTARILNVRGQQMATFSDVPEPTRLQWLCMPLEASKLLGELVTGSNESVKKQERNTST